MILHGYQLLWNWINTNFSFHEILDKSHQLIGKTDYWKLEQVVETKLNETILSRKNTRHLVLTKCHRGYLQNWQLSQECKLENRNSQFKWLFIWGISELLSTKRFDFEIILQRILKTYFVLNTQGPYWKLT